MLDISLLQDELAFDEGRKTRPYVDTKNKISIGIGRNLTDVGLSASEINFLFKNDVTRVVADLDTHLSWWGFLDDTRQRVLANMCFNLGITRLLGFHNFLEAAQVGKWEEAAEEMLKSEWARQVGPRAVRLSTMMRTGRKL